MTHEKIIRREDGSRVKIRASFSDRTSWQPPKWSFQTWTCSKGKRTWLTRVNMDDYAWRRLDADGREADNLRRSLLDCTEDEAMAVMLELWEQMKPDMESILPETSQFPEQENVTK